MAQFKNAFDQLKGTDRKIAKQVIMSKCKWIPSLWSMKMNGDRQLSSFSEKKVNELQVVESTFRAFGVDAWTGAPIT